MESLTSSGFSCHLCKNSNAEIYLLSQEQICLCKECHNKYLLPKVPKGETYPFVTDWTLSRDVTFVHCYITGETKAVPGVVRLSTPMSRAQIPRTNLYNKARQSGMSMSIFQNITSKTEE